MKYDKLIIGGVEYDLVPTKKEQECDMEFTMSYNCLSECEQFEFFVLLKKDGTIWEGTETLTLFKEKDNEEFWDSSKYLKNILKEQQLNEPNLTVIEASVVIALLNKVHALGWL